MATPVEATTSLSSATSGNGTTVDFVSAKRNVATVVVVNGTVTGGIVAVQVSHDGTNWVNRDAYLPQTGVNHALEFSGGAYRYWRASILSAVTGGGTVTATFMEAG